MIPTRFLVPVLVLAGLAVPASAQPAAYGPPQASTSNYADGTGDSAIDSLNASQLNGSYRGPYYQVRPGTNRPIGAPPPPARAPYPGAVRPTVAPGPVHPSGGPDRR